ncbi:MAG: hypothetical protein SGARI_004687, partial [Bacillariaceae sp.]
MSIFPTITPTDSPTVTDTPVSRSPSSLVPSATPSFRPSSSDAGNNTNALNVLYFKSAPDDNPDFRAQVSSLLGGGSSTDFVDGTRTSPTLAEMESYDCIMVHYQMNFIDPVGIGNNLADFVDGGGVVVFSDGFTGGGGSVVARGIEGRIRQSGYSPVGPAQFVLECGTSYNLDGSSAIYDGITMPFPSIENNRDDGVALQGDGVSDGFFADGNIAAAYRPDFRVIYLGGSYCWGSTVNDYLCPG